MPMITLREATFHQLDLRTRMPFRYGIATLTETTHLIVRFTFEIDGKPSVGFAADNLAPKWFTKDAARSIPDEVAEMLLVIRRAISFAREIRAATPFAFWRELYTAQAAWGATQTLPPLLVQFGASIVERGLLEAFCRARGTSFAVALRADQLGLDLGALRPSLATSLARDWLPPCPPATIHARHTVGLSDPIDESDLAPGEHVEDGLPHTLVECIRFYGLTRFKLKVNGDAPRDRDRLVRMAKTFATECHDGYFFSVDGNESFREVGAFVDYARDLLAAPELKEFWRHILFFEQPWHREVALSPLIAGLTRAWPDAPPIIIDESDVGLESLPEALALGYAGTSHKNCKGIFKSVANACLLAQRRAGQKLGLLSGEDLTNTGPVGLGQDLAVQAALGITHVERNGQHYFKGLASFPVRLQAHVLEHHGDLFTRAPEGWPRLDIRRGQIDLRSVNAAPLGVAGEPDLSDLPGESV